MESEFTAASSNSLQATLSQVFPSGHPYQQFGLRHLASPLTHSYSPWTGCIKQRAFALHHYPGSWFPAEHYSDFLWHKGTSTPSKSKMQVSGSYCVVGTADFVSQQWVISPLSDTLKCFCWKLCIQRLGKLKISSNFLFLIIKATSISKNTLLIYVSITRQKPLLNYHYW